MASGTSQLCMSYGRNFLVERFKTTPRQSIPAIGSGETSKTWSISKTGYRPIAILGLLNSNESDGSGESNVNARRFYLTTNSDNTGTLNFYGGSFSGTANIYFLVDILWERIQ